MISQINAINGVNVVSRPAFRANEVNEEISAQLPEQNEINAVTSYGIAAIKMAKKFDIKPLEAIVVEPNYTHSIEGERIYTSEGKLYSIVSEDDITKTTYTPNEDDIKFFDSIVTTDKETGNVIKKQDNYIENGQYSEIIVSSYSPETGDKEFSTTYVDGEVDMVSKYVKKDNGDTEYISYSHKDNKYYLSKESKDGKRNSCLRISKDLKFVDFDEYKEAQNKELSMHANFYNGGLVSLSKSSDAIVPNLLGREPLDDADLVPAEKCDVEGLTPDFDGEKTFFSNGAVESITIPDGTVYFTPDDAVEKLVSSTKEIEFTKNGTQTITEKIEEDETKTTTYYADSDIKVCYEKDSEYKTLYLTKDLKPDSYFQGKTADDREEQNNLSLYYKQGFLESAYNS